jgi:hypothetical protein
MLAAYPRCYVSYPGDRMLISIRFLVHHGDSGEENTSLVTVVE